jgi:hypothetical protein
MLKLTVSKPVKVEVPTTYTYHRVCAEAGVYTPLCNDEITVVSFPDGVVVWSRPLFFWNNQALVIVPAAWADKLFIKRENPLVVTFSNE